MLGFVLGGLAERLLGLRRPCDVKPFRPLCMRRGRWAKSTPIVKSKLPPTIVEISDFCTNNGSSATATLLNTAYKDDIIVAHVMIAGGSDGATATAPVGEGWTQKTTVEDTTNQNSVTVIFWKRWGSGSTDNLSCTFTSSSGTCTVQLTRIKYCYWVGDPFEAVATNHGSGTTLTAPTVTSGGSDRLWLKFFNAVAPVTNISAVAGTPYYFDTGSVYGAYGALTAGAPADGLNVTSFAPAIPTSFTGALVFLHVSYELAAGANGDPTGWTLVSTKTHAGGELNRLYAKVLTGGEGPTVSVPVNSGTGRQIGRCFWPSGYKWSPTVANNYASVATADFNSGANPGGPTISAIARQAWAFIGYDSGGTIAAISGGTGVWAEAAAEAVAGSAAGGIGIVADIASAASGLSGGTAALGNVANSNVTSLVTKEASAAALDATLVNSGATGTSNATATNSSTWTSVSLLCLPTYITASTTPSWIAVGTRDTTGTSSTTPAYGTNVAGDTFVMVVTGRITALTVPAGWTQYLGPNDFSGRQCYVLIRDTRSTGGESGTVSVTLTANSQIASIHTFRNVSTSFFVEALAAGGSSANGNTLNGPTVATFNNNRLAVMLWASGNDGLTPTVVTGMSGGTWVLKDSAVTSVGSNCSYALSTADMSSGGTISGGTATMTAVDEHSIVAFALVGTGATSFTIGDIPNIVSIHQADVGVTQSSGSVSSWADQSGNGHTLTGGSNPTYSATGWQSSKPGITWTGSNYMINSDAALGNLVDGTNVAFTVFATVKFTSAANYATLMEWSDNSITSINSLRTNNTTGGAQVDRFAFGEAHDTVNIQGVPVRVCFVCTSSGIIYAFADGRTAINGVNLSGTFAVDRVLVGNNWNTSTPLGTMTELIVCTGDQSASFKHYRGFSKYKWGG